MPKINWFLEGRPWIPGHSSRLLLKTMYKNWLVLLQSQNRWIIVSISEFAKVHDGWIAGTNYDTILFFSCRVLFN